MPLCQGIDGAAPSVKRPTEAVGRSPTDPIVAESVPPCQALYATFHINKMSHLRLFQIVKLLHGNLTIVVMLKRHASPDQLTQRNIQILAVFPPL